MVEPNILSLKSRLEQQKERAYSVVEISKGTRLNRRTVTSLLNNDVKRIDFATLTAFYDFFRQEGLKIAVGDLLRVREPKVIEKEVDASYRVIIDPDMPELTIGDVIDDIQAVQAQTMARRPDETVMIGKGCQANLWLMDDGWWLFDVPQVEGNRAEAESKEQAIQMAIQGIEMIRRAHEKERRAAAKTGQV